MLFLPVATHAAPIGEFIFRYPVVGPRNLRHIEPEGLLTTVWGEIKQRK